MPADRQITNAIHYVMWQVRVRMAVMKLHDPESGALSLEWVAIAIVLVAAAIALATFLTGKLATLESLIPS